MKPIFSCTTRRNFLRCGLVAGAGLPWTPRTWAASAKDPIQLGIIGCGWRGGQLLNSFGSLDGVTIAGLCDPDPVRLNQAAKEHPQASTWADMRRMFDSPKIDAVVIAACNHWHALAAIWAMEAGKHVYVEKPLSHLHWEGGQIVKAAAKYQRICQVGTQQRSDPMQAEIKNFLHEERALGEIQWVRVNRFGVRGSIGKRSTPLSVPTNVDFNLWLGPAQEQPIYRDKLHYDWHWDWNTGSGEMGNWGVHIMDDVRNNVFQDNVAYPRRVAAAGGRYVWNDAGETPNLHFAMLDTGSVPVVVTLCNLPNSPGGKEAPQVTGPNSGYIVYCAGGRLEGQRGMARALDNDGKVLRKFKGTGGGGRHQKNFIEAVRNQDGSLLNAPVQVGHHSTAWCNFANLAFRAGQVRAGQVRAGQGGLDPTNKRLERALGEHASADELLEEMRRILAVYNPAAASDLSLKSVLNFDSQTEHFTGSHEIQANQLLRRQDRKPFVVPEV